MKICHHIRIFIYHSVFFIIEWPDLAYLLAVFLGAFLFCPIIGGIEEAGFDTIGLQISIQGTNGGWKHGKLRNVRIEK